MCIIAVKKAGQKLPTWKAIRTMFANNPHGAGFMFARDGKVEIHKGFMDVEEYIKALKSYNLTQDDSVVYHFRISTQAGVNPGMTHPFPLTRNIKHTKALDVECKCGIAHNGIIALTSNPYEHNYSDTALFITEYLSNIIRKPANLRDQETLNYIYHLAKSKFAIMDATGYVATIGDFEEKNGIMYSNNSWNDVCRRFR